MSNFAKGFNQGLSPYLGSIADLLSKVMIDSFKRNQNFSNAIALQNNKAKNKAQEELLKNQQEQQMILQQQKIFDSYTSDPIKNSNAIRSMSPETLSKVRLWYDKADKTKYKIEDTERGKEKIQYTVDAFGNEKDHKTIDVIPTKKSSLTVIEDGKTVKYDVMSDGTQVPSDITIDKKQGRIDDDNWNKDMGKIRNDIYKSLSFKGKSVFGNMAERKLNADSYHNAVTNIDFELERKMTQHMRPEIHQELKDMTNYKNQENVSIGLYNWAMDKYKAGEISSKEMDLIGAKYYLLTGNHLK